MIVDLLRRQALFNALVTSCVRVNSLEDVDTSIMFEMTCLDPLLGTISLTFEHPGKERACNSCTSSRIFKNIAPGGLGVKTLFS